MVSPQRGVTLRIRAALPYLPTRTDDFVNYAAQLDRAIADLYSDVAKRVQTFVRQRGRTAFGAADTVKAVMFDGVDVDDDYVPTVTLTWNAYAWVTAITDTGFTINTSAAPGGAGADALWTVVRS